MNKKISIALVVLMLASLPMTAMAISGSQTNPVTVNVNYVIQTNTDFTVDIVPGQTALNFSAYKTQIGAEPDGQNASLSIAWANITNSPGAQMAQTFKVKLGAANPTGITLKVASDSGFSDSIGVSATTAQAPGGWYSVAQGSMVKAYFQIDTTGSAISGTNTVIISAVP